MCQLGVNTNLRTSTTELDPTSTHTPTAESPLSTGRLGTDEVSTGGTVSPEESTVRALVDDIVKSVAAEASKSTTGEKLDVGDLAKAVTAAPLKADAPVVQQVITKAVTPPSLREALTKGLEAMKSATPPKDPPGLPTSAEVRAKYGEAKDDIKLFGKTLRGMSTEYKAILRALDNYHTVASQLTMDEFAEADIIGLKGMLDVAEAAINSYHGNREGIGDLAAAVARERQTLSDVLDKAPQQQVSMTWGEATEAHREASLGTDGPQFKSLMADAQWLQDFLDKIPVGNGSGDAIKTLSEKIDTITAKLDRYGGSQPEIAQLRAAVEDTHDRLALLASRPEILAGRKEGMNVAMSWGKAIQMAPMLAEGFVEKDRTSPLKELGKGAVNTVYTATFTEPAGPTTGVVKFDLPTFPKVRDVADPSVLMTDAPQVAADLSMDLHDPQLAQRSMASNDVTDALGFNISVSVKAGVVDGSLVTVMGKAEGASNDKRGFMPVMKRSELDDYGQAKVDAYKPLEGKLDDAGKRLEQLSFSPKAIGGFKNLMREMVQTRTPPVQADKVATMTKEEFATAFSTRFNEMIGNDKYAYRLNLIEGGVGVTAEGCYNHPITDAPPQFLMSKEEFVALIRAGNDGKATDEGNKATMLLGKDGWQQGKLKELFLAVKPDGTINEHSLRGMKVDKGVITIERDRPMDIPYGRADMVKNLTELQIADFLTAQADRHQGNYFIHKKPDGTLGISGIDGELSWTSKLNQDPNASTKYATPQFRFGHARDLPTVVDSDMRDKILSLQGQKLEDLKTKLAEKLSPAQIEAFEERLAILKAHLADASKCTVIKPTEWGTHPSVAASIKDLKTSYVARELDMMARYHKAGVPLETPPWG